MATIGYNYTKPRGPIQAMFKSPGPATYGLPDLVGQGKHDPRSAHYKNPAYSFGVKHGKLSDDCSPGPCYQPEGKIYKNGKDGTPHYSLYARYRDIARFNVPGPGAYSPEQSGPMAHFHHPKYSFGSRTRQRKNDCSPAANAYTLDGMTGKTIRSSKRQAPVYTMRPKHNNGSFTEDLAKTPGPGTYSNVSSDINKNKAPLYSMTSRNMMPGDNSQKPGPGAHSPERVYINKKKAPESSFGIRHSDYVCPIIVDPID